MILIMLTAILAGTLVLAVILTALLCWVLATPAFCGGTVVLMWLLLLIVFVAVGGIDPRDWGGTAFAKRSAAMKAPVGLLSGSAVCDSRWRGVAPTSATPTRSLRKCRRIAEVKSRMDRKFSRIENLWPRDGSCPLPLRSKHIDRVCEAMKAPVGLLSGRTVCDSRWRGFAPTSSTNVSKLLRRKK